MSMGKYQQIPAQEAFVLSQDSIQITLNFFRYNPEDDEKEAL
ncbi:MAG: hypothetical protein R6U51_08910 [Anaerolineales bacterium]